MSKQFLGVIIAVILVFVGIFAFSGNKSSDSKKSAGSKGAPTQHIQGKGTTGVTLVEYGDYQCPYCQQYYGAVKEVQAKYNDQIKFQFRNFPLSSNHRNAFAAARAAEAAATQNKFWEMHDILYQNNDPSGQSGWVASSDPQPFFVQFAKQIGLDETKFNTDFASSTVNSLINADLAEGTKLGVSGTPTFFLDGKKVTPNNTVPAFEKLINAEIAKKTPAAKD